MRSCLGCGVVLASAHAQRCEACRVAWRKEYFSRNYVLNKERKNAASMASYFRNRDRNLGAKKNYDDALRQEIRLARKLGISLKEARKLSAETDEWIRKREERKNENLKSRRADHVPGSEGRNGEAERTGA